MILKKTLAYIFILVAFFSNLTACYAQKENNIWYFGNKAGLDFNSGSPVNLSDGQIKTNEGCASISNQSGQLLFYTDGEKVWNRNHQVMPNGYNLLGHKSSTQAVIIVPLPSSNNTYYIFTTTHVANPEGLRYSIVNMNSDGGLGDIVVKNVLLYSPVCEKLCAYKMNDGNYWVISHAYNSNAFIAYKVNSEGIVENPVVSNVGVVLTNNTVFGNYITQGHIKFSPNGSKIVCVNGYTNVELFDFNLSTGIVSNPKVVNTLQMTRFCYGAEFSPSGSLLYISSGFTSYSGQKNIYQYNIEAEDITSTEVLINNPSYFIGGALQLGPDCKIYCTNAVPVNGVKSLSIINNPDIIGIGCGFQLSSTPLSGTCVGGLPQQIERGSCQKREIINDDVCVGENTTFTISGGNDIESIVWNFGDGTTSTSLLGEHYYTSAGNFTVSANFTTTLNEQISKTKLVTIANNPIANNPGNINICGELGTVYNLNQLDNIIKGNQSADIYGISYFNSLSDAENHINVQNDNVELNQEINTFYAKVYKFNNFDCNSIISFSIFLNHLPDEINISDLYLCDDSQDNDGKTNINLNGKNEEIFNSLQNNNYIIKYFFSQEEAITENNSIVSNNFQNVSNPQKIYARVTNKNDSQCYKIFTFNIIINQIPVINIKDQYIYCEEVSNSVTISLPNNYDSYLWSTGESSASVKISTPGNYSVSVTKNYATLSCTTTKTFEIIKSNIASIKKVDTKNFSQNNTLVIYVDGNGIYEYSIDGYTYQDSNVFSNLNSGEYTIYVKDKQGCGISNIKTYILSYPLFFTPNGDGYNDVWQIENFDFDPSIEITIFDRYGKIVFALNKNNKFWNGKYNNKDLASDDYWFKIERENNQIYHGHFSLKR